MKKRGPAPLLPEAGPQGIRSEIRAEGGRRDGLRQIVDLIWVPLCWAARKRPKQFRQQGWRNSPRAL